MNFKLDENFGRSIQKLFQERAHDCLTVREQALFGAPDHEIIQAAVTQGSVLVTMDHDFGNVLVYPPEGTNGIVIINSPGPASLPLLRVLVSALLESLSKESVMGKLWIVEPGRIREHEPEMPPGWEDSE